MKIVQRIASLSVLKSLQQQENTHTRTQRQWSRVERSVGMGDTDTCLSLRRWLDSFHLKMSDCSLAPGLTPRLPLSRSHFLLGASPRSVFVLRVICLPLLLLLLPWAIFPQHFLVSPVSVRPLSPSSDFTPILSSSRLSSCLSFVTL